MEIGKYLYIVNTDLQLIQREGPTVDVAYLDLLPLSQTSPMFDESADDLAPLEYSSSLLPGRLKIGDERKVLEYYDYALGCITQAYRCSVITKLINAILPEKWKIYPYTGEDKPQWWPSEVPHKDPRQLTVGGKAATQYGYRQHNS